MNHYGGFTVAESETDTRTYSETDKVPYSMTSEPKSFSVLVQYEHLQTIVQRPFLFCLSIGLGLCKCERTITTRTHSSRMRTGRCLPYGRGLCPRGSLSGRPPSTPVDRQTRVKFLPCPKLRLRAVIMQIRLNNPLRCHQLH